MSEIVLSVGDLTSFAYRRTLQSAAQRPIYLVVTTTNPDLDVVVEIGKLWRTYRKMQVECSPGGYTGPGFRALEYSQAGDGGEAYRLH